MIDCYSPKDMGLWRLMLFSCLILVLCLPIAQGAALALENGPKASLSEDGLVQLPADMPLSDTYEVDISAWQFPTSDAAANYLAKVYAGAIRFEVDVDANTATLFLDPVVFSAKAMNWGVNEWNDYFTSTHKPVKP